MFYKFLAQEKFNRFSIDKEIQTIKKYGLMNVEDNGHDFVAYEDGDTVDIYYNNLHFQRTLNPKENSLKVFIKFPDSTDHWVFDTNNHRNPTNESYKVYHRCEIVMMDDGVYDSEVYRNGNWDKYVYRNVRKFQDEVVSITDTSRFNKIYKKS